MIRFVLFLPALLALAACSDLVNEIGQVPKLSPMGSGLDVAAAEAVGETFPENDGAAAIEDWTGSNADLFRDAKARRAGDIVTVLVEIDDRASLNNNTNRSRKSKSDGSLDLSYSLLGVPGLDTQADGDINANTSSSGQGATVRSEKVSVSIAAVVVKVLPNGLFVIQGTQEVVVNYEARVLTITGLVHPKDISSANRVPYDKIAEVRVSYGGKGRITDMQQPGWGQQIIDKLSPY